MTCLRCCRPAKSGKSSAAPLFAEKYRYRYHRESSTPNLCTEGMEGTYAETVFPLMISAEGMAIRLTTAVLALKEAPMVSGRSSKTPGTLLLPRATHVAANFALTPGARVPSDSQPETSTAPPPLPPGEGKEEEMDPA